MCEAPKQVRNRADARVGHETHHSRRTGAYVDVVRLSEDGVGCSNVERSGDGSPAQNEKPGFSLSLQTPSGVLRQIDPLEHEVGIGDEKRPFVREPVGRTRKRAAPASATAIALSM